MQGAGGVGGLLKVTDAPLGSAIHNFVAYDGNGNVAALLDASTGVLNARYEYGPFAEPIRTVGTLARKMPFRFSTKYTDNESGLVYYGYRYYNPSTGGWISKDPIHDLASVPSQIRAVAASRALLDYEISGTVIDDAFGNDDGLNPYLFAHNLPSGQADTLGTGVICTCPSGVPAPFPTWTPTGPPFARGSRIATVVWTLPCTPKGLTALCRLGCGTGVCGYNAVYFWLRVNAFGTMTWLWVTQSGPNNTGNNCP
jgi:RHS repeat-associated protein